MRNLFISFLLFPFIVHCQHPDHLGLNDKSWYSQINHFNNKSAEIELRTFEKSPDSITMQIRYESGVTDYLFPLFYNGEGLLSSLKTIRSQNGVFTDQSRYDFFYDEQGLLSQVNFFADNNDNLNSQYYYKSKYGKLVSSDNGKIDIRFLNIGIYFAKITQDGVITYLKFLKI